MLDEKSLSQHYLHGDLLSAIEQAIVKLGKTLDTITIDDLGPVDEFHIGSRLATTHFMAQLNLTTQQHILDIGCGLGGPARFVAHEFGCQVSGIDLSQEYVDTGNQLCQWVGLQDNISLTQGSALDLPFTASSFDAAYMMHVGMNIDDKSALFEQVSTALRSGSLFGIYDVMRNRAGELAYPVPWATDSSMNKLASSDQYIEALQQSGFEIISVENRAEFALEFFTQMRLKNEKNGGPPPLGLHTLMQSSTAEKLGNMVANINNQLIAPVEIIAKKL